MELEPFVLPALDDVAVPAASPPAVWYQLCPVDQLCRVEESFVEESKEIDCLPDLDRSFEHIDSYDVSILSSSSSFLLPLSIDLGTTLSIHSVSSVKN